MIFINIIIFHLLIHVQRVTGGSNALVLYLHWMMKPKYFLTEMVKYDLCAVNDYSVFRKNIFNKKNVFLSLGFNIEFSFVLFHFYIFQIDIRNT